VGDDYGWLQRSYEAAATQAPERAEELKGRFDRAVRQLETLKIQHERDLDR